MTKRKAGGQSMPKNRMKFRRVGRSVIKRGSRAAYTGPLFMNGRREQAAIYTFPLTATAIISSSSGIINTVAGSALNLYTAYANLTAMFSEYRIVSTVYEWVPIYENTTSSDYTGTGGLNVLLGVIDRADVTTALTAYTEASYESAKLRSVNQKQRWTVRMTGTEDSDWIKTSVVSGNDSWALKLYATNLVTASRLGALWTRSLVQFRGRNL